MEFQLEGEYIKLDQLLKATSIASSGGEAKQLILSEMVRVNGVIAHERGKKIRSGDMVEALGETVTVREG